MSSERRSVPVGSSSRRQTADGTLSRAPCVPTKFLISLLYLLPSFPPDIGQQIVERQPKRGEHIWDDAQLSPRRTTKVFKR
ncbi:hypothetical protein F2P81_004006 [Scophthalmus maximus]|uniref:Uncharacterized protein n=1 Tax=Scophthalmus maximus TaxID=52904 RepID=A0A6A4TK45_SCOMX|nr:hypothetical protein F2P81_004006 [Scophthalmus maximus]